MPRKLSENVLFFITQKGKKNNLMFKGSISQMMVCEGFLLDQIKNRLGDTFEPSDNRDILFDTFEPSDKPSL